MIEEYFEILKKIEELEENWDGYGAVSPDAEVIRNTYIFLPTLLSNCYLEKKCLRGSLYPTPYGSICFDLEDDNTLLSIEIGNENVGWFSEKDDEYLESNNGIKTDFSTLPEELEKTLKSLYM